MSHSHEHTHSKGCCEHSHCEGNHTCSHNHTEPAKETHCAEGCSCSTSSEDSDDPDGHEHHEHSGCGCSHDKPVTNTAIILLAISVVTFIGALFVPIFWLKVALFAASTLIAGYDLFLNGLKQLFKFKFEENVLLLIAVVASFCLGEFPEACIVTILFKLGSYIESYAVGRSKKNMEALTAIRPDFATIKDAKGEFVKVDAKSIAIDDIIYLRAGDRLAVDCVVVEGESSLDTSALTGEAIPQSVKVGDILLSGSINLSGLLACKTTKTFSNSTASQIIELVYSSSTAKGKTEGFISRVAKVYTPIVILLAIAIAVIPPLLSLGTFHEFIMRSLIFLVASCPCALVISIPLSFFSSIGAVSKKGVLVKGSMFIERLAKIDAVAFDKTGTLTSGILQVESINIVKNRYDEATTYGLLNSLEKISTHPIATAITTHLSSYPPIVVEDIAELAGFGMSAGYDGAKVIAGGVNMMLKENIDISSLPQASVYLSVDGEVICYVTIKEDIRNESRSIVKELEEVGVKRTIMLTGDNEINASKVANLCNIQEVYSRLLPKDKVDRLVAVKQAGNTVLFVGDGINDAPVLATADIGISMGLGSEIANASSDVILASNNLSSLPKAIRIAKRGMAVVNANIIFALAVKIIVLILGGFGFATMWFAVFADIGVTILTVLNAIRLLGRQK